MTTSSPTSVALWLSQSRRAGADRLRAVAYGLLRFLQADPARTHFLTVELGRAGERATLIWTETIVRPLFELIDEGRSARSDAGLLTPSTADAVGGGILLQILAAVEKGDLEDGEQAVPQTDVRGGVALPRSGRRREGAPRPAATRRLGLIRRKQARVPAGGGYP